MILGAWLRRVLLAGLVLVPAVGAGFGQGAGTGPRATPEAGPSAEAAAGAGGPSSGGAVLVGAVEGAIGPATVRHVERLVERATGGDDGGPAEALVLRLDTPGGLTDSTREVIAAILASPVPVIGWVAPPGAHAASAGTYILYATHLAAMAPATNIGAATPVQLGGAPGMPEPRMPQPGGRGPGEGPGGADEGGSDGGAPDAGAREGDDAAAPARPAADGDAMSAKVTNDAVAFIRSLAEMRDRNPGWAERAVREAATLSAEAALAEGVVELVAEDLGALLAAADGRSVTVLGEEWVLRTASAPVEVVEAGAVTRLLGVISNPNVALVLLMIGVYGIIFEFLTPGTVLPGVIGAISLTLGLYALNQLPLDYAGLALIGLGIAFMLAEGLSPSFGVLGFGGLVAFVLGSAMLVDTDVPEYQISWWLIAAVAAVSGAVLILLMGVSWRAYARAPAAAAPMAGVAAEVLDWAVVDRAGAGHVHAEGERWSAVGPADLAPGERVRVERRDGLVLTVSRAAARAGAGPPGEGREGWSR